MDRLYMVQNHIGQREFFHFNDKHTALNKLKEWVENDKCRIVYLYLVGPGVDNNLLSGFDLYSEDNVFNSNRCYQCCEEYDEEYLYMKIFQGRNCCAGCYYSVHEILRDEVYDFTSINTEILKFPNIETALENLSNNKKRKRVAVIIGEDE